MSRTEQETIDPEELRELVIAIAIEGNEQYKANMSDKRDRPYRRGVGTGKTQAAQKIADRFDLDMYSPVGGEDT